MRKHVLGWRGPAPATVLAAAAALAFAAAVSATPAAAAAGKNQDRKRSSAAEKSAGQALKVNVAGQQVFVDPDTGRLVQPTREEARRLAAAIGVLVTRSPEDLTVRELPDGTQMVDMQESAEDIAVATIGANGEATVFCVHGAEAAEAIVQQRARVKAPAVNGGARKPKAGKEIRKRGVPKVEEE